MDGIVEDDGGEAGRPPLRQMDTITSTLSDSRFAVLPHGKKLEGWTAVEKAELNDHVRHMLHSRRSKFKRGLKGFGAYVSKRESLLFRIKDWDFIC